jgi:hypothetical protein
VPSTLFFPATNAVEEVYIHILKIKDVIKKTNAYINKNVTMQQEILLE